MSEVFPDPIKNLPEADIPLEGIKAHLSQSDTHQILFMEFEKDVDLPEHFHAAQIGIVLEGKIDLMTESTLSEICSISGLFARLHNAGKFRSFLFLPRNLSLISIIKSLLPKITE